MGVEPPPAHASRWWAAAEGAPVIRTKAAEAELEQSKRKAEKEAEEEAEEVEDAGEVDGEEEARRSLAVGDLSPMTPLQVAIQETEKGLDRSRGSTGGKAGKRGDNRNRLGAKAITRDCATDATPFEAELSAIMRELPGSLKMTMEAKCLLRVAAEAYLETFLHDASIVMKHCKRQILCKEHVRVAKRLRA